MKKILLSIYLILNCGYLGATTNSVESTISEITVATSYARIKLANMSEAEGCTKQDYYYLDLSNGKNTEMFSALLAAKATQESIVIQTNGCLYDYPWVAHIFLK